MWAEKIGVSVKFYYNYAQNNRGHEIEVISPRLFHLLFFHKNPTGTHAAQANTDNTKYTE